MHYRVISIEEDLDYGCEERPAGQALQAVLVLLGEDQKRLRRKVGDALLREREIKEGDRIFFDGEDLPVRAEEKAAEKGPSCRVRVMDEHTWAFEEEGVRFFLLEGSEKAMLIDSGMMTVNARALAEALTDLPLMLINTHADRDHLAGCDAFEWFYMHPAEASNFYNTQKKTGRFVPVWDGDRLDLGNRPLRILTLPGHTPGSIAILDEKSRRLFSGDPVQDGRIFMFGLQREMRAYRMSLEKLDRLKGAFDEIWPAHGHAPLDGSIIMKLHQGAGEILAGRLPGRDMEVFSVPVTAYDTGAAVFLCDRPQDQI